MTSFLASRRERLAPVLELGDAVLVIGAGEPIPLPENTDQTYPFRSHAEYFYAAGHECVGGIVAYDPHDGPQHGWISFVPEITEGERIWEGRGQRPGTPRSTFESWLFRRRGRDLVALGAPVAGVLANDELTPAVRERFTHARRVKDEHELALLRRGAAATAHGYARLEELLRPGVSERQLQIELEAEFFRHGATGTGYGTIVGTGPNSAVLHFSPTARTARPGEFVLVDAGTEFDRYVTDVTRTYVVGGATGFQRELYAAVLSAQVRAVSDCRAGVEWRELHLVTSLRLVEALVAMNLLRGSPESLVEQEAHTLFFPHGLGHMVGLGVRDAGGLAPGRQKDPRPSLSTLRMDLPLQPGYVVTVEPGLYFIPALLNDPVRRDRFHDAVNWSLAESHLGIGGVRIEDNVLVTDGEPEVLTAAIPKTW